jgi:lipopolysaccharide/colanic/teichoic acid biosynthesis glycosyltransferase
MTLHEGSSIGRQGSARGDAAPALGLNRSAKRVFDVLAAVTGLTLFSPIILIASIAIKLDSRGPIFCRETQYGYKRPIRVLKFRSQTTCVEGGRGNSRVTQVGRILRRSGIDKLPQLFNVLAGDMSIVGPRPFVTRPDQFENYPTPLLISGVKPGLIGYGRNNEFRRGFSTTEQRINDDLHYAQNWSLFLDIKLILTKLFT